MPSLSVSSMRHTSSFSTARSFQSCEPSPLRSFSQLFSLLFSGANVLCRNLRRSSTVCNAMDSVIQLRCPRMSNSEFFWRLVRLRYTLPASSMAIATGSGARESEAQRSSLRPSASFTTVFSRISLACALPVAGSSFTTTLVLLVLTTGPDDIGAIFIQDTTATAVAAIRVKGVLRFLEIIEDVA